jgi:hypothetical protein
MNATSTRKGPYINVLNLLKDLINGILSDLSFEARVPRTFFFLSGPYYCILKP